MALDRPPAGRGPAARTARAAGPLRRGLRDNAAVQTHAADSRYAWTRLAVTLALMTIGSGAMYVIPVALPASGPARPHATGAAAAG